MSRIARESERVVEVIVPLHYSRLKPFDQLLASGARMTATNYRWHVTAFHTWPINLKLRTVNYRMLFSLWNLRARGQTPEPMNS